MTQNVSTILHARIQSSNALKVLSKHYFQPRNLYPENYQSTVKVKLRHNETCKISKKNTSHTPFPGNYYRIHVTKMRELKKKVRKRRKERGRKGRDRKIAMGLVEEEREHRREVQRIPR